MQTRKNLQIHRSKPAMACDAYVGLGQSTSRCYIFLITIWQMTNDLHTLTAPYRVVKDIIPTSVASKGWLGMATSAH